MVKYKWCDRLVPVILCTIFSCNIQLLAVVIVNNLDSCACWTPKIDMAASSRELSISISDFALKLYKSVAGKQDNVLISPMSISSALSMLLGGAKGETLEQMKKVLNIDSMENTLHEFANLMSRLNSANITSIAKIANRVFLEEDLPIVDDFTSLMRKVFLAEYGPVSFSKQPSAAKEVINSWVSEMTNGKINELISDDIDPMTRLILASAIYFKGFWAEKFSKQLTKIAPFQLNLKDSVKVEMMYQEKRCGFTYDDELKVKVIELPYQSNAFSMIVILPDEVEGLRSVEEQLDVIKLNRILREVKNHSTKVELSLPKFKLEESLDLKAFLSALGMINAFKPGVADLTGIVHSGNLHVEEVIHKTYIDVNEEGTEAAAATGVRIVSRSIHFLPNFYADHPFIFIIVENTQNLILFIGALKTPNDAKNKGHEEL